MRDPIGRGLIVLLVVLIVVNVLLEMYLLSLVKSTSNNNNLRCDSPGVCDKLCIGDRCISSWGELSTLFSNQVMESNRENVKESIKRCKVVDSFKIIDTVEDIEERYGTTDCQEICEKEYGEDFIGICLTRVIERYYEYEDCKGKLTYVSVTEELGEPVETSVSCKNSPSSFGNSFERKVLLNAYCIKVECK